MIRFFVPAQLSASRHLEKTAVDIDFLPDMMKLGVVLSGLSLAKTVLVVSLKMFFSQFKHLWPR